MVPIVFPSVACRGVGNVELFYYFQSHQKRGNCKQYPVYVFAFAKHTKQQKQQAGGENDGNGRAVELAPRNRSFHGSIQPRQCFFQLGNIGRCRFAYHLWKGFNQSCILLKIIVKRGAGMRLKRVFNIPRFELRHRPSSWCRRITRRIVLRLRRVVFQRTRYVTSRRPWYARARVGRVDGI